MAFKVLVISMVRSPERRERVRREMESINLPWQFLDAVDGNCLDFPLKEYSEIKVKKLLGFNLMAGEIGAFLSHKNAWKICSESSSETLILEDDFIFLPHFEEGLRLLLDEYSDWELVRLQALADSSEAILYQHGVHSVVQNTSDCLGCTAYLLKPSAAQKLLDQSGDIYEPIDHFLEHIQKHGVKFLALKPYPVSISGASSTVENRPERHPIRGLRKWTRSFFRVLDRNLSENPWFPK